MATGYEVRMLFAKRPLQLNFSSFSKEYEAEEGGVAPAANVEIRAVPQKGEVKINYFEADDYEFFLKALEEYITNETKENSNELMAIDYGELSSHAGNVRTFVKNLALDEKGQLKSLNTYLLDQK